ncbi:hypothetical protein TWF730_005412 [Orbilia blumenaviensis]|uniref:Uncharacterized protein n=1 Tax=Orbilia blumenaviensis TaxID=1796055 RepID=A0AAV9VIQ3_9PEZI
MAPVKSTTLAVSPTKDNACEAFAKKGRNVEVLIAVLSCSKRPDAFGLDTSQVDWNLVAQRLGLKNANVASTRFGQVKKELIKCAESMNLMKSAASKNNSGSDYGSDGKSEEGDVEVPETPKKVKPGPEPKKKTPRGKASKGVAKSGGGRGRGRPKKVAKVQEEEEEEEEEEAGPVVEHGGESGEDSTDFLEHEV